ncbi:MAG: hypothetical protein ACRDHY_07780 [Anaerolineales bacterium]
MSILLLVVLALLGLPLVLIAILVILALRSRRAGPAGPPGPALRGEDPKTATPSRKVKRIAKAVGPRQKARPVARGQSAARARRKP